MTSSPNSDVRPTLAALAATLRIPFESWVPSLTDNLVPERTSRVYQACRLLLD